MARETKRERNRPAVGAVWRLSDSLRCAAVGLWACLRRERNFRIQLVAGGYALALGLWLELPVERMALLVLMSCAVLSAEALNTAIEATVDLSSPEQRPLARLAKDAAAGGVLVLSLGSVAVGWLLLGPLDSLAGELARLLSSPARCVVALLSAALSLMFIFMGPRKYRPQ